MVTGSELHLEVSRERFKFMHVAILEGSQASSSLEYFEAEVRTTDLSFPHSSSNSTSLLSNLLYVYMSPNMSSSQLHVFIFLK